MTVFVNAKDVIAAAILGIVFGLVIVALAWVHFRDWLADRRKQPKGKQCGSRKFD